MNRSAALDSASGLRPASAFVSIALVLALAGAWVGRIALAGDSRARENLQRERDALPEYTISDREGRPLAVFVQRLDLVLCPRALWQAHTPETIATAVSGALDGSPAPAELFEAMLPDARDGVVRSDLVLDVAQARRVAGWIRGGPQASGVSSVPVEGFARAPAAGGGWHLDWQPALALSEQERRRQLGELSANPLRWSRRIADELALALAGAHALRPGDDEPALEAQRAEIWRLLLPTNYCVAVRDFDAACAPRLLEVLNEEHVLPHQMQIARERNRRYPAGRAQLLGAWGFIERPQAQVLALERLGFPRQRLRAEGRQAAIARLTPDQRRELPGLTWQYLAQSYPLTGLERACDRLLAQPGWRGLERRPAEYLFRRNRPVHQAARSYYVDWKPASKAPRVETTLDALLQRQVRLELEKLLEEHRPALAMAIVVDLASGDVLALDAISPYERSGFPPLYHAFTPGSTAKVVIMASALESGRVHPGDVFDVGNGEFHLPGRVIREARNSRTGRLTAVECLAFSVNAGLAQIGMRVPDSFLHAKLKALHYGEAPRSGLGGERAGYVPPLPWRLNQTHASVSFGHEMSVTLWQHAAGLAAVVRGGEWRPLRLLAAVEQGDLRRDLAPAAPERVFAAATCAEVREMMFTGAREGTGRIVASPDLVPGLVVGTKTGTAEKVPTEICLHAELAHQEDHHRDHTPCSSACRRSLAGSRPGHRSCYTSSMCAFGRREGDARELMVLVVADEPRGAVHYGSQVSGATAIAILKEALGSTVQGELPAEELVAGFVPSAQEPAQGADQPWAPEVSR